MNLDANNLYRYAMSIKLPVDGFEWVEDLSTKDEDFIKNYDEDSDVGYFNEADVEYPKELHTLHSDLPFLPEGMEVNKYKKLICNLYDHVDHISSLKQALNHGLILKKVHRVIKFNQRAWLKEYIDKNTEYRMNAKNDFYKDFFKLMNNAVFGKTMENVRKHRDIKLVTNDSKRNKLVSEPNNHTTKWFSEIKANKPIYLGLATLSLSKIRMYKYWYDDMKPKYGDNIKLCYIDTDSFIMHVKTEDFYEDIANYVENNYDTSNYTCERPLPIGKNKKVIGLMTDELGGKIMEEFVGLRPYSYSCYSYLMNDGKVDKKAKGTKKCVIKRCLMFDNYSECLKEKKKILKSQQRFKSDGHDVYTEEINKIALSYNDDKRLIAFDGITTYLYGISAGILCKQELLPKVSRKC